MKTLQTFTDIYNFALECHGYSLESPYFVGIGTTFDGKRLAFVHELRNGQEVKAQVLNSQLIVDFFNLVQHGTEPSAYAEPRYYSVDTITRLIKMCVRSFSPDFETELRPVQLWAEHMQEEFRLEYGYNGSIDFVVGDNWVGMVADCNSDSRELSEATATKIKQFLGSNESIYHSGLVDSLIKRNKLEALLAS